MTIKLSSQVHKDRLALHKNIPFATPLVIYIEPSGYCNLKCVFCPHGCDDSGLKKDIMPFKLFKKMIDDLTDFPSKIKLLRICGNGDPLLNKEIVRMMQYAYEKKVSEKIELITNGILLTHEHIDNLPKFLNRLVISIEGLSSEDYQNICGTKVNPQKLINTIRVLNTRKKKCVIHIKIHDRTLTPDEDKMRFFRLFDSCCDEFFIEKIVPMWPQLDFVDSFNGFRWGEEKVVAREICAQIFKGIQVQADGEVAPCCVDWKRVNVLGNINTDSVLKIWRGKNLRKLQLKHLEGEKNKTEPCKDCTANDYCEYDNIDLYAEECIQRIIKSTETS